MRVPDRYKWISPLSLFITLGVIHWIDHSLIIPVVLIPLWFMLFRPFDRADVFTFVIATVFIVGQDYSMLSSGGFEFAEQDILLMPYYEPFMWGFYYLNIKRFFSEGGQRPGLQPRVFVGLVLTVLAFAAFGQSNVSLLTATLVSTGVLLLLFHEPCDLWHAAYALALGFAVELFGVSTGVWSYPEPDFLGMPYWFSTMWISMGILGRRFLFPFSAWLDRRVS